MNSTWNLDPIYTGFDDPAFASDLEALKKTVSDMTDLTAALDTAEPTEGLRRCVALWEQSEKLVGKLANYASLRQAADTKSPEAGSAMGRIMGVYSGMAAPNARFQNWASKLPDLMDRVDGDDFLRDYHFLFEKMQENSRYLLPGQGEEIMAKMEMSGGSAWSDMQQYLTSTVPVTYRGPDYQSFFYPESGIRRRPPGPEGRL